MGNEYCVTGLKPKGYLYMTGDKSVSIALYGKIPCWFHRVMQRILLGFK